MVQMGGKQLLWYKSPPKVHAALLRGTTADLDGNVSFEKEALYLDSLNMVRTLALSYILVGAVLGQRSTMQHEQLLELVTSCVKSLLQA